MDKEGALTVRRDAHRHAFSVAAVAKRRAMHKTMLELAASGRLAQQTLSLELVPAPQLEALALDVLGAGAWRRRAPPLSDGANIGDCYLVTEDGYENLSRHTPLETFRVS